MSKFKAAKNNAEIKEKYLSSGDIKAIQDLKKAIQEAKTTVTCMGLYNHGKSTLLNTLIKDFEHNTFKTADVRETSANKMVEHGNINFVDTPGLNAKKDDDKRVMDAVKQSDINIFVHTVTTGEFVEKEIAFFNSINKNWKNPQEFIDRTIFVASRIDKANSEEDIVNTVEKMSRQLQSIFHADAIVIPVSAIRYAKGMLENKKLLVKKSNIAALEQMIQELSDKLFTSIQETREIRLGNKYESLIKQLHSKVQKNKLEISKQKREQKKYFTALHHDIEDIESTLSNMYAKLGV